MCTGLSSSRIPDSIMAYACCFEKDISCEGENFISEKVQMYINTDSGLVFSDKLIHRMFNEIWMATLC